MVCEVEVFARCLDLMLGRLLAVIDFLVFFLVAIVVLVILVCHFVEAANEGDTLRGALLRSVEQYVLEQGRQG